MAVGGIGPDWEPDVCADCKIRDGWMNPAPAEVRYYGTEAYCTDCHDQRFEAGFCGCPECDEAEAYERALEWRES